MNYVEDYLSIVKVSLESRAAGMDHLVTHMQLTRLSEGLHSARKGANSNVADGLAAMQCLKTHLKEFGYICIDSMATMNAVLVNSTGATIAILTASYTVNTLMMVVCGDEVEADKVVEFFGTAFPSEGATVVTYTGFTDGSLKSTTTYLKTDDSSKAHQVFYPNMKLSLQEYYTRFMASRESVLVLIGPPGTGKSTFIRSLIASGDYKTYVTYNKDVIESDALINKFYASNAKILTLEDVDKYLGKRTEGNSLMSTYLNSSEGIVQRQDKKIIFSTNLASIDKIDPALLRRGRCFDVIKFDLHTVAQAEAVAKEMGLSGHDFSTKAMWTLSEILNPAQGFLQSNTRVANAIGF